MESTITDKIDTESGEIKSGISTAKSSILSGLSNININVPSSYSFELTEMYQMNLECGALGKSFRVASSMPSKHAVNGRCGFIGYDGYNTTLDNQFISSSNYASPIKLTTKPPFMCVVVPFFTSLFMHDDYQYRNDIVSTYGSSALAGNEMHFEMRLESKDYPPLLWNAHTAIYDSKRDGYRIIENSPLKFYVQHRFYIACSAEFGGYLLVYKYIAND